MYYGGIIATRVSRMQATGRRQRYASALSGVWDGLATTLACLEAIAADPVRRLHGEVAETLPALQYALHRAEELAAGIDPPPGAERAHAALRAALLSARDLTGEVVERLTAEGPEEAARLALEWRGALFQVRLARRRLADEPALPAAEPEQRPPLAAAAATAVVLAGTAAFTAGAVVALWPLWAAGLLLVALGFVAYRP